MTIADAARATRKYPVDHRTALQIRERENGKLTDTYTDFEKAYAAGDRLNLLAVLEAIREPSENVARAARETADVESSYYESDVYNRWRAMVDALIAEVMEAGNDA